MSVTAQPTDYSQSGEQAVILAWAASHEPGSFVDFGAYDGERYSNTAALADLGWPGLLIEAAPDAANECAKRYADRPDVTVVLAAFDPRDADGPTLLHWSPAAMYSSLHSGRRPTAAKAPLLLPRLDHEWLAATLNELPAPLFASIDIEGDSLGALEWLLENAPPDCVCVEANNPADRNVALALLAGWDLLAENDVNLILAQNQTG
jgi:hypothetical protein